MKFLFVPIVAAALLFGQTSPVRPSFEVASLKRNVSLSENGGGEMTPGGRFRLTNVDVQTIILIAYRTGSQLFRSQLAGAPDWTSSERYDITAKVGDDLAGQPVSELFRLQPLLLQSLLEDRFSLKVHRETRQLPIYALIRVTRDDALGPQLRRATVDCTVEPRRCGLESTPGHFAAGSAPLSTMVSFLAANVQRFVVDRTGLDGRFEVTIEWTPDRTPLPFGSDAPLTPADKPSLFTALQEQLGLKLEPERGPVDVVVVDHIEHPTED